MTSKQKMLLIAVFLLLSATNGYGQETLSREQEREIKVSGKYFFGEGTAFDETEAKSIALNELTQAVLVSLLQQSIKTEKNEVLQKTLEIQAKTAHLPLTGRVRILAWIAKDNINGQGDPDKITTELKNPEPKNQSPVNPVIPESEKNPAPVVLVAPEPETKPTPDPSKPPIVSPVIQDLATSGTYNKFTSKVSNWKRQGKEITYGRKSSFQYPDKCYIAVFNSSKTLIALLDAVAGNNSRTDLLTGNIIQNPELHYSGNELLWIQIR